MNLPDLSSFTEITFGPGFPEAPLRGKSYLVESCQLAPGELTFTMTPALSEFDTHTMPFHDTVNGGAWVSFRDAAGQILAVLGHPDPA
jgi:hypothetical protein